MTVARETPPRPVEMGAVSHQAWKVSPTVVDMTRPAPPVQPLEIKAEPQDILVDAHKSALVVVDMQNDFCAKGGWLDSMGIDVSPNRKPIEPLRRTVEAFRAQGMPVVWANWGVRKDLANISPSLLRAHNPHGQAAGLGRAVPGTRSELLLLGSWGAQVVDEINPGTRDIHVVKHRFSAFWDTDADAILRNLGIKTLFIGGVNIDQCVMTTLEDANFLGYDTILVEDCAATTSPEYCTQSTLFNVKRLYGFVTRSDAILAATTAR